MSTAEFDYYHKWLGIPKSEQPPHYYRLLGIPLFEDDPQVVEAAADRQMAFLRKYQVGEHGAAARDLLNEVSRARLCLLKAESRARYDDNLKALLAIQTQAISQSRQSWPLSAQWKLWSAGAAIVLLLVIALAVAIPAVQRTNTIPSGSTQTNASSALSVDSQQVPLPMPVGSQTPSERASVQREPLKSSAVATKQTSTANPPQSLAASSSPASQPAPLSTQVNRTRPAATPEVADAIPTQRSRRPIPASAAPKALPTTPVALLTELDAAQDASTGIWELSSGLLSGRSEVDGVVARIALPHAAPAEYDLLLTVERQSTAGTLTIGLSLDKGGCALVLDAGLRHDLNGLSDVDGRPALQNPTSHRHRCFPPQVLVPVVCKVRANSVRVLINGESLIQWEGKQEQLSWPPSLPVDAPDNIVLAIQAGHFQFSEIILIPVPSDRQPPETELPPGNGDTPSVASTAGDVDSEPTARKHAPPTADELDASRRKVREQFKVEYGLARKAKERDRAPRIALAKALFGRARDTTAPDMAFVMLTESADFAAEAGELDLAWEILQDLGARYDVTPLPLMQRAAHASKRFAKSPTDILILCSMYVELIDAAVREDDYVTALKSVQDAITAARKTPDLRDQLQEFQRHVTRLKTAFEEVAPALQTLESDPENTEAHKVCGQFYCFDKQTWSSGLPHLAQSGDQQLVTLATSEQRKSRLSSELLQLGDDWWEYSAVQREPQRTHIREHAADIWQSAIAFASVTQRRQLEERVARLFLPATVLETTGGGKGIMVSPDDLEITPAFTAEFWVSTRSNRGVLLSKRHQFSESSLVLKLSDGEVEAGHDGMGGFDSFSSNVRINDGHWHHIALVRVGAGVKLFIDGKGVGQELLDISLKSQSAWKIGYQDTPASPEPAARFARIRFSKSARYLINFRPDKSYSRDSQTLHMP